MIPVSEHKRHSPVQKCLFPHRVIAEDAVAYAVVVAFIVGVTHHIKSVFVAELIEKRHGRIVRRADHVDIGLLHHFKILAEGRLVHVTACPRMMFMSVDSLQLHLAAVYQNRLAVDLYPAYSGAGRESFRLLPVHKPYVDIVEGRFFG